MNSDNDLTQNSFSVLLEIGTEEVPSRFLPTAISDLSTIAAKTFEEYRIDYSDIAVFATPRRLALMVNGVSPSQKDNSREVFGPAKKAAFDEHGDPTKAATGFASSLGIPVTDLRIKQKGKGDYIVAVVEEKGGSTKEKLPELLEKIVLSLHFPKSMRWGNGSMTFARPIAWILALAGTDKVEFEIDGLRSSNQTCGHRFLSPAAFQIRDILSYRNFLETNFVILDQDKRRELIIKSMARLLENTGLQVVMDDDLLETVSYLVEYPVAVLCGFDREYLKLPKELLISVMKDHQKYFAVCDNDQNLANAFIVISNTKAENAETIKTGAERVIKARFDDARFYYTEDAVKPLADRVESLRAVTFHDQLGSLFDKTVRISNISGFLSDRLSPDMKDKTVRAAELSKADLITGVVREFPELQGVMGRYYAQHDNEDMEVANALEEQYLPKGFGGSLPQTHTGALLSLADKIDNVASFFSIGLIPTGSEDPFALRRQAMGIVSVLLDRGYDISMKEVFEYAVAKMEKVKAPNEIIENIMNFMTQRLEFILSSKGHQQDIIKAVLPLSCTHALNSVTARAEALATAQGDALFSDFLLAIKRVKNIAPKTLMPPVESSLFQQDEEKNLNTAFVALKSSVIPMIAEGNFAGALNAMLLLTDPINSFFDKVLVMDKREEVRTNRLSLLKDLWETVAQVADFSRFQT